MIVLSGLIKRYINASALLRSPRSFERIARSIHPRISKLKIKEDVLSLFNSSDWEPIYSPAANDTIKGERHVIDDSCSPSVENVKKFLEKETGKLVEILPSHIESQMIIVQIDSPRTRISVGESLIRHFKKHFNRSQILREGLSEDSDWAVIDLGSIIVHLMSKEARREYKLVYSSETSDVNNITRKTKKAIENEL